MTDFADIIGTGLSAVDIGAMVDPTTTKGDLIVHGASTTRLGVGTNGQTLTADSTQSPGVKWSAPAATQIAHIVLGASAATVTFASIPSTYNHLRIVWQARGDVAASLNAIYAQFNGDTAANYYYERIRANAATVAAAEGLAVTKPEVARCVGSTATAGGAGCGEIVIPNYAGTTFKKNLTSQSQTPDVLSTTGIEYWTHGAFWNSTAAITQITLLNDANFIAGSTFTLYGMT